MATTESSAYLDSLSGIQFTAGFKLIAQNPLDVRLVVDTKDKLNYLIDGNAAYEGMKVYVTDEKSWYGLKDLENKTWELEGGTNAQDITELQKEIATKVAKVDEFIDVTYYDNEDFDGILHTDTILESEKKYCINMIPNGQHTYDDKLITFDKLVDGSDSKYNINCIYEGSSVIFTVDPNNESLIFDFVAISDLESVNLNLLDIWQKLDEISQGANKVTKSTTNGNIRIDDIETNVYTHPTKVTDVITDTATDVNGYDGFTTVASVTTDANGHISAVHTRNVTIKNVRTLATSRYIDGVGFDGSANITHYGVCETELTTAIKNVTIKGFSLVNGARLFVRFVNGIQHLGESPKLSVNGGTAVPILIDVQSKFDIATGMDIEPNKVLEFIYDSTSNAWYIPIAPVVTAALYAEKDSYGNNIDNAFSDIGIASNTITCIRANGDRVYIDIPEYEHPIVVRTDSIDTEKTINNGTGFNVITDVTSNDEGHVTSVKTTTVTIPSVPKLTTARKIDGIAFDGSADTSSYGACSTSYTAAAKTVSITGFNLVNGARVSIKFTDGIKRIAGTPITLNINNTGAKSLTGNNIDNLKDTNDITYIVDPNAIVDIIYDSITENYAIVESVYSAESTVAHFDINGDSISNKFNSASISSDNKTITLGTSGFDNTTLTIKEATESNPGLMSITDKTKLDTLHETYLSETQPVSANPNSIWFEIIGDSSSTE